MLSDTAGNADRVDRLRLVHCVRQGRVSCLGFLAAVLVTTAVAQDPPPDPPPAPTTDEEILSTLQEIQRDNRNQLVLMAVLTGAAFSYLTVFLVRP
jgi:hypothetical protein